MEAPHAIVIIITPRNMRHPLRNQRTSNPTKRDMCPSPTGPEMNADRDGVAARTLLTFVNRNWHCESPSRDGQSAPGIVTGPWIARVPFETTSSTLARALG